MGSPSQIAGAGLGSTAGGSILGAFGSISSGISNQRMFDYQASIAKLNQQIDAQNAEFAVQTGRQQGLEEGLQQGQQMGKIVTAQASSNFDVNSGSSRQVQQSQRTINSINLDVIRSNAAKTAYNFETQGAVAGAQAQADTMAGQNALSAGLIGAGSSILGGAGSVSTKWLQNQQMGLWSNPSGGEGGQLYGT